MSTMDRRQVLRLAGGLAAAGLTGMSAAACAAEPVAPGAAPPNGKRASIGLLAPVSGAYAKIGADITLGFQQYLSERGQLLGLYRVDLTTVDEGASTADAAKAAASLFSDGVVAIVGVASPVALAAIAPAANAAEIPVLSANTAPLSLTGDFLWRVSSVQGEAGQAAAVAAAKSRKAFILRDNTPESEIEVNGFTAAFETGNREIVGSSVGTDGFGSRFQAAIDASADVVFAAHTGDAAVALLTAYRASGVDLRLIGPGTLTESIDLARVGPLPENVLTAMFYAPDLDNPENERFVADFHSAHAVPPTSAAMAAYDAAGLLDRALRAVQDDLTGDKINDALGQIGQINSPRGAWTFNDKRSPLQTWYLRQLRLDGQVPSNMLDRDLVVLSDSS